MKVMLASIMLMGLVTTGLCDIECYTNKGITSWEGITKTKSGGFKSCIKQTVEAGGIAAYNYGGSVTLLSEECTGVESAKQCNCNTNLCNSAPPTTHMALITITAMALLTKLMI